MFNEAENSLPTLYVNKGLRHLLKSCWVLWTCWETWFIVLSGKYGNMHPVLIHFRGLLLLDQTRIDGAEVATTSYYVRIIIPSGWHRTKTLNVQGKMLGHLSHTFIITSQYCWAFFITFNLGNGASNPIFSISAGGHCALTIRVPREPSYQSESSDSVSRNCWMGSKMLLTTNRFLYLMVGL